MDFLRKIKIIDFSQRLPGPYCCSILADLGAEVVMVERCGEPPETRDTFPGLFQLINRNKKSITLNLKSEAGKEISRRLIETSDVVVEGFQPGVAAKLGIGYDEAREVNQNIIYCSISGYGQDGPYRDRVGHDVNYLSLSGILSIPGQPDAPPTRPGVPIVDLTAGIYAATSILAALVGRNQASGSVYLDVSMYDAMIVWMSVRAGNALVYGKPVRNEHLSPLNTIFLTKDGKKISLGLVEENFWKNFVMVAGQAELLDDDRFRTASGRKEHANELLGIIGEVVAGRTASEWEQLLDWRKVPYGQVYSIEEAFADPHLEARNLVAEIDVKGIGRIREVLFPVQFSGSRVEVRTAPPEWGEHTDEVLSGLGYTEKDIERLKRERIV